MKYKKYLILLFILSFADITVAENSTWIDYSNINDVLNVAVTETTIWSNNTGGLVRWNRETKTWDKFMPTYGMQFNVHVVDIAPNGDVWISAFNELIRYDGVELEVFTKDDVDVEGGIVAIAFEPDGDVWVGNQWGYASKYDGEQWIEFGEEDGLGEYVHSITVHPDSSVWFGTTGKGVCRYKDGEFTSFSINEGLLGGRVTSLTIDDEGNVWVGSSKGISVINKDENSVSTFPVGFIDCLATDQEGTIWTAVADFHPEEPISNVFRFTGSSMEPYDIGADSVRVNKIVADPLDGIWFCSNKWLGHMTDDGWDYYRGDSELYLNTITALETASDGSVWFGHNRGPGAISQFTGDDWILYPSGGEQRNDIVSCIHEALDGSVWFGPALCSFSDGAWNSYDELEGMKGEVRSFASAPDGALWIGCDVALIGGPVDTSIKTVWQYHDSIWTGYSMDDGFISTPVTALTVDHSNIVWVGTHAGLCCFNGTDWEVISSEEGFNGKNVYSLATDQNGVVWACTDNGLYNYSKGIWELFTASDGTVPANITVITFDNNGGIWMGTDSSGLLYDNGATLQTFTTENGLTNSLISSLDIALDGSLWVGTAGGVSRYIYQNNTLVEEQTVPTFELISNYPNPFNPSTTLSYTLAEDSHVTLAVYNLSGQKVVTIVDSAMPAGTHQAVFDGSSLASGMYVYRLDTGKSVKTGKMMLMK